MIIRSRAPVRISFGGGGTDVSPYCNERGGCVVSATISKYSYATLETRSDQEIHIESVDFLKNLKFGHINEIVLDKDLDLVKAVIKKLNTTGMGLNVWIRSDVPPRSGLGASAAAFASLIGLFSHMRGDRKFTNYEISELAYQLEREELAIGGGYQDQYATVFGGLNYIEFGNGWTRVNPLKMKRDHILELEKHLILVYTRDRPAHGSDIIADQTKNFMEQKDHFTALDKTKEIAQEIRYALNRGDLMRFGELLNEAWKTKKQHSPMIADSYINNIYDIAIKNGALGGKISGAGGGGFMFFLCEPNKEHKVAEVLKKIGMQPVSFTFDFEGLQTWEVNSA